MGQFDQDRPSDEPEEPTEPCSMCKRETPVKQIVAIQGRRLCLGCAAAFFEDEDE